MASPSSENIKPLLIEPADTVHEPGEALVLETPRPHSNAWPLAASLVLSGFWIGGSVAYLLGYYGASGLMALPL